MAFVHNVEIVWEELMSAFTSGDNDRRYYLDRYTGEIFFIPSTNQDEELWRQLESNQERFLEIPHFDYGVERQLISNFTNEVKDAELRAMLSGQLNGNKLYGNLNEIISFFPEEEERLITIKDEFFANRVKNWLAENNLFTMAAENQPLEQI